VLTSTTAGEDGTANKVSRSSGATGGKVQRNAFEASTILRLSKIDAEGTNTGPAGNGNAVACAGSFVFNTGATEDEGADDASLATFLSLFSSVEASFLASFETGKDVHIRASM
jgi:hypothetical protein